MKRHSLFHWLSHYLRLVGIFLAGIAAERLGIIAYFSDPFERQYVIYLFWQHLQLVGSSMLLATLVGLGIGILLSRQRFRRYIGITMYCVSLGQTIPGLALFAFAMIGLGVGMQSAVLSLFIICLLPIARNTLTGILSVPHYLIDAARGIGLKPWQILLECELPNALTVIMSGVRVALILNIGTASLAYLIGGGGLGDLIFTGINLMAIDKLLAGIVLTMLLAFIADYACLLLSRWLIPKGLTLA